MLLNCYADRLIAFHLPDCFFVEQLLKEKACLYAACLRVSLMDFLVFSEMIHELIAKTFLTHECF